MQQIVVDEGLYAKIPSYSELSPVLSLDSIEVQKLSTAKEMFVYTVASTSHYGRNQFVWDFRVVVKMINVVNVALK